MALLIYYVLLAATVSVDFILHPRPINFDNLGLLIKQMSYQYPRDLSTDLCEFLCVFLREAHSFLVLYLSLMGRSQMGEMSEAGQDSSSRQPPLAWPTLNRLRNCLEWVHG